MRWRALDRIVRSGAECTSEVSGERRHRLARDFAREEGGAVAVIFAIVFAAVLMTTAITIEFALGTSEQTREQQALDAATLAASDFLGLPTQDTEGPVIAEAYFKENIGSRSNAVMEKAKLDAAAGTVSAKSTGTVVSGLMKVFGADNLRIGAASTVGKGDERLEIALVLDNSGSMAGTYITDLKTAAKNLASILYAGASGTDKVKIGVVPFAASVNVGSGYRSASWMDGGISPLEYQNVSESRTRFQLFDDMGVNWGGCLEVRSGAYASNAEPPTAENPDSLFVPMLAPDEPDSENDGGDSYTNSYLVDDGGSCTPQPTVCTKTSKSGRCTRWEKVALSSSVAQTRTCKYKNQAPSGGTGPNTGCTTKPLLRLTTSLSDVNSTVESLIASGNTNIGEGLTWGWRMLSPAVPFADGRPFNTEHNKKIIILMTDGENTYTAKGNQNHSTYSAYGYAHPILHPADGRLGETHTASGFRSVMDANLLAACANAKAAGVVIYTIGFRLENDPASQGNLQACATAPDKYFLASNGAVLITTFQQIARQLNKLRVTG